MLDLANLTAKVDALAAVIPNLQTDYVNLKAEIEALRAQIDTTAQARVDALVARIESSLAALNALDNSVPPVPPPA